MWYTRKDVLRVKQKFRTGDKITFDTRGYVGVNTLKKIRVDGLIEGVYSHGILVSYTWRKLKIKRFIPYVDIMIAEGEKKPPFVDRGERRDEFLCNQ